MFLFCMHRYRLFIYTGFYIQAFMHSERVRLLYLSMESVERRLRLPRLLLERALAGGSDPDYDLNVLLVVLQPKYEQEDATQPLWFPADSKLELCYQHKMMVAVRVRNVLSDVESKVSHEPRRGAQQQNVKSELSGGAQPQNVEPEPSRGAHVMEDGALSSMGQGGSDAKSADAKERLPSAGRTGLFLVHVL